MNGDYPVEGWVRDASSACAGLEGSTLEEFIGRFGCDLPGSTEWFEPVVHAHLILSNSSKPEGLAGLIEFAAMRYPDARRGREYKRAFLSERNPAGFSEITVLKALATTPEHQAFDADDLEVRSRSAGLWQSPEDALNLLFRLLGSPRNPLSDKIFSGLSSSMPPAFLIIVIDAPSAFLAAMFERNPDLACSQELWALSPAMHKRISAALMHCRDSVLMNCEDIVRAALAASADPTSPSLIDVFGPATVPIVMDWLDADAKRLNQLPNGWRWALGNRQHPMLEWLNSRSTVRPEVTSFVLDTIGTRSLASNPFGVSVFAKRVPPERTAPEEVLIPLATRLLQVSLATAFPASIDLASSCLDIVYHAAAESRLTDGLWRELSSALPDGFWWTWDRCQRLRSVIAEKFRSEQWPANRLSDVTRDDRLFEEIVSILKERRSGRQVLADAARSTESSARRALMLDD